MEPEAEIEPPAGLEEQDTRTPEQPAALEQAELEAQGGAELDPIEGALQRARAEASRIRESESAPVDTWSPPGRGQPPARSPRGDVTDNDAVYARLTDPQKFTGAHKHRFDSTGLGRGLDGRDSIIKGGGNVVGAYMGGSIHDLSQITRSPRNPRFTGTSCESAYAVLTFPPITIAGLSCAVDHRYLFTQADFSRLAACRNGRGSPQIFDRLTDPHLFTGAHKHRFDKHGHGRGLNGRDYVGKGTGTRSRANPGAVHDLSQITRSPLPTEKGKPVRTSSGRSGRGPDHVAQRRRRTSMPGGSEVRRTERRNRGKDKPEIFTKLTDAAQYTATHRHRFDPKTGKGKGLGGRDSVQKGSGHSTVASYDGGAVHDLSQITRPEFYAVNNTEAGSDDPTRKSKPGQKVSEGIPPAAADTIFAKLTDPRLFTGSHRARQTEDA